MNTEVMEPEVLPQIKIPEVQPVKENDPWKFDLPKINPNPKG